MRALKLITAVALVMAVTGTAWAVTVPSFPTTSDQFGSYMGVHVYARDRDQSAGYAGDPAGTTNPADGTYTRANSAAPWVGINRVVLPGNQQGLIGNEDTWAIFAVRVVDAAGMFSPGTPVADLFKKLPNEVTYEWTDTNNITNDTCLVGMVYGGWDSKVVVGSGGTSLTVYTKDLRMELWAVDKSAVDLIGASQGPAYDPLRRTAANRYTGWLDAAGVATGTCLLTGEASYHRFIGTELLPGNPFTYDGQTVSYFSIDNNTNGIWNKGVTNGNYFTDPDGFSADMKLTFDIDPGQDGWSVNSHDDGGLTFAVPEPLTMLGFAFSGLFAGGYLRRRNRNR